MKEKSVKQRLDELSYAIGRLHGLERLYKDTLFGYKDRIDRYREILKKNPSKIYESMEFLETVMHLARRAGIELYIVGDQLKKIGPAKEETPYMVGMGMAARRALGLYEDLYRFKSHVEKHEKKEEKSVKECLDELSSFIGKVDKLEHIPYKEVFPELKNRLDMYRAVLENNPHRLYDENMKFLEDVIYLAKNVAGALYNVKENLERMKPKGVEELYISGMEMGARRARDLYERLSGLKMFAEKHKKQKIEKEPIKRFGLMILIMVPLLVVCLFPDKSTGFAVLGTSGLMSLKLALAVITLLAVYFLGKPLKKFSSIVITDKW